MTASIESMTSSDASRSFSNSSGVLRERSRSSTNSASLISASGNALRNAAAESAGRKASSAPIRGDFAAQLPHVVGGFLHHVDRAAALGADLGNPEWLYLGLVSLHAVAEITGLLRSAFHINEDRQITADPHCVHAVEKERAMAAEEVLDVVLGGGDEHIDPGLIHELVQSRGVQKVLRPCFSW